MRLPEPGSSAAQHCRRRAPPQPPGATPATQYARNAHSATVFRKCCEQTWCHEDGLTYFLSIPTSSISNSRPSFGGIVSPLPSAPVPQSVNETNAWSRKQWSSPPRWQDFNTVTKVCRYAEAGPLPEAHTSRREVKPWYHSPFLPELELKRLCGLPLNQGVRALPGGGRQGDRVDAGETQQASSSHLSHHDAVCVRHMLPCSRDSRRVRREHET